MHFSGSLILAVYIVFTCVTRMRFTKIPLLTHASAFSTGCTSKEMHIDPVTPFHTKLCNTKEYKSNKIQ